MLELPEIPDMTNTALWAIILGFFQPIVLNLLLNSKWSPRTQAILAFVFSIIVGVVTALLNGSFNGLPIVTAVLLVAVVSISAYRGFWKQVTPNMKEATSPGRHGEYEITKVD